jgi:hypothetical protein
MRLKMTEALGTVHTPWRGLLRGWWWPVDPKSVFKLMADPVPEIKDASLYPNFQIWHNQWSLLEWKDYVNWKKILTILIGTRTCELPAFIIASQQTTLPRAPFGITVRPYILTEEHNPHHKHSFSILRCGDAAMLHPWYSLYSFKE